MRNLIITVLTTLCLTGSTFAMARTAHPLQDIRDAATNYVQANIAGNNDDVLISAKTLDPRLKLPLCTQKLQAHMPYSNLNSGHTDLSPGPGCQQAIGTGANHLQR